MLLSTNGSSQLNVQRTVAHSIFRSVAIPGKLIDEHITPVSSRDASISVSTALNRSTATINSSVCPSAYMLTSVCLPFRRGRLPAVLSVAACPPVAMFAPCLTLFVSLRVCLFVCVCSVNPCQSKVVKPGIYWGGGVFYPLFLLSLYSCPLSPFLFALAKGMGSNVIFPVGVWGGAPVVNEFLVYFEPGEHV